jgi:hypothetical protein
MYNSGNAEYLHNQNTRSTGHDLNALSLANAPIERLWAANVRFGKLNEVRHANAFLFAQLPCTTFEAHVFINVTPIFYTIFLP